MFSANAYRIRFATADDADTLRRLAERGSQEPLVGRVLIGHLDGTPVAALSLGDGHVIADPSHRTGHVIANLRVRADAIRAFEATPSLRDRIRAGLASYQQPAVAEPEPAPVEPEEQPEPEPERVPVLA
jgi:hypothetical protein